MSKETRIGLLVGLLFIIMFGLVLANMLPKSDAPPVSPSPLGSAVNAPAEGDRDYGYIPPTPTMDSERRPVPAAPVAPARPVDGAGAATAGGTPGAGAPVGTVVVSVTPPDSTPVIGTDSGAGAPIETLSAPGATTTRPAETDRVTTTGGDVRTTEFLGDLPTGLPVHTADDAAGARDRLTATDAMRGTALPAGSTLYEVKAGDSLYKIARTVWGQAYASKNALILEANKDKIKNPNNLRVGMKIVIPPSPGAPAATPGGTTPTSGPSAPTTPGTRSRHDRSPVDVAGDPRRDGLTPIRADDGGAPGNTVVAKTYTIKSGDTLHSLARTSGISVDKILALNKGVNPNRLKIGQKLTIPG